MTVGGGSAADEMRFALEAFRDFRDQPRVSIRSGLHSASTNRY